MELLKAQINTQGGVCRFESLGFNSKQLNGKTTAEFMVLFSACSDNDLSLVS